MTIDNIGGRLAAIVCAVALGAGGTSLLFGDVIFGDAAFTQKHFQTITIVAATTLAWMVCTSAFKKWHVGAGIGFLLLALAGSAVIVWNSLGRQTEGVMMASEGYDKIISQRSGLEASLARDRAAIAEKRAVADKECATGEGPKCRAARATVAFYENSAEGYEARIARLETPKPVDASAEAFANLANALGRNGTKAKALSMLVMPYFITILFEFGFTMSLHYAFRPFAPTRVAATPTLRAWGPEKAVTTPTALGSVSDAELTALRERFAEPAPAPNGSDKGGGGTTVRQPNGSPNRPNRPRRGGYTKNEAIADLLTRLALGERFGSQDELRERYGVAKSTMSEWVREWEAAGLIPARTVRGRCKALETT